MGIGMGRDVERAIGALSTLVVGVGILVVRDLALSLDLWLLRWEQETWMCDVARSGGNAAVAARAFPTRQ